MVLFSGSYLACLCVRACSGNLSWQYVNSMNWIVCLGEGDIGGCIWFGAPSMHRMSGLSLARHWHGFGWQVHWSSHSGIVCSCGWLLKWPAFVSVKNLVFLLACNVWVMRCSALLCRAILSPLRNGCSHVDSKWGHVSRSFLWHSVQLGFGCVIGQNMFFLWLPMYWAYLNLRVWVIWVSGIFSSCQK
jgi:hypothetical protein